jgi:hypothetical protein
MIETTKIECPKTEDNPAGFYVINAEDKTDDMKVFAEKTPDDMTVAELREALTAAGVEFPDNAKKADLAALLSSLGA